LVTGSLEAASMWARSVVASIHIATRLSGIERAS
jgi:hypothetical protein